MSRPVFSFRPNLQNAEHQRAWEILCSVSKGQKNQYLVEAILKKEDGKWLEKVIRETVREELKSGGMPHPEASVRETIPNQMLDFLSKLESSG